MPSVQLSLTQDTGNTPQNPPVVPAPITTVQGRDAPWRDPSPAVGPVLPPHGNQWRPPVPSDPRRLDPIRREIDRQSVTPETAFSVPPSTGNGNPCGRWCRRGIVAAIIAGFTGAILTTGQPADDPPDVPRLEPVRGGGRAVAL